MTATAVASAALPLAGIRVLDFGHTVMGPSCGLVLADLGADVVRIEPPGGDRTRRLPGFAVGFFASFNRNKRSVCIDLKQPDGRDLVRRLMGEADVLIENFAPGVMERLGLGWEDARAINPRLVYCALKGYLPGPYEHLPALDEVVQMQAGLAYMTGPPGRPLRAGASVVDIVGGMFGVIAIQAALRDRDRTGQGQLVQSALFESTAFLVTQHMAASAMVGAPVPPMPGRRGAAWCIYDVFETADDPVFIGVTSQAHWERFCQAFPLDDLRDDPALATHDDRVRQKPRLIERLAGLFATIPVEEILQRCRAALIPCAPVARPDQLFDDPHLNAAGGLVDVDLSATVHARLPALPIAMDGVRPGLRRQPPAAGADTREILAAAGVAAAEIDRLAAVGTIDLGVAETSLRAAG
ncbi:CoA transferase [Allostella vacuolata]|nr:CoA transferase [Stella vacuolata]